MFDFLIDIVPRGNEDKLTTTNKTDDHALELGLPPHQGGAHFNTNTVSFPNLYFSLSK